MKFSGIKNIIANMSAYIKKEPPPLKKSSSTRKKQLYDEIARELEIRVQTNASTSTELQRKKSQLEREIEEELNEIFDPKEDSKPKTMPSSTNIERTKEKPAISPAKLELNNILQAVFLIFFFVSALTIGLGLLLNSRTLLLTGSYIFLPIWILVLLLYVLSKWKNREQ